MLNVCLEASSGSHNLGDYVNTTNNYIAITTSKCGLRPRLLCCALWGLPVAGLSAHSVIIICMLKCVSLWKLLTCHCIALCKTPKFPPCPPATRHHQWLLGSVLHAKVQRFRKGDLLDSRREDSPIYSLLCSIVCNPSVLAVWRSLLQATLCFHPVANATEVRGGSQPRSPQQFAWIWWHHT